jgi:hypothetical protein
VVCDFQPAFSGLLVDDEGHGQRVHLFHGPPDQLRRGPGLARRDLQQQLVVDLQENSGRETLALEIAGHGQHRQLHQVRRGAL